MILFADLALQRSPIDLFAYLREISELKFQWFFTYISLFVFGVCRQIMYTIFHCPTFAISRNTLNLQCSMLLWIFYSKFSCISLYLLLSLVLYFILLSHLFLSFSLILFLSPSLIFIVYWTLGSLYSFCWTLLDFTFSSTSLLAQQNVSERLTFYANCTFLQKP